MGESRGTCLAGLAAAAGTVQKVGGVSPTILAQTGNT